MWTLAKKLAKNSTHHQHHHAVVITKGSAIMATGYNHDHKHAEVVALGKLFPDSAKGMTLWSFRWRKNGTWGNAKPCEKCAYWIGWYGVKKVYYTNEEGKLVRL